MSGADPLSDPQPADCRAPEAPLAGEEHHPHGPLRHRRPGLLSVPGRPGPARGRDAAQQKDRQRRHRRRPPLERGARVSAAGEGGGGGCAVLITDQSG